jgi:PEP-CTERM motif-containing protein
MRVNPQPRGRASPSRNDMTYCLSSSEEFPARGVMMQASAVFIPTTIKIRGTEVNSRAIRGLWMFAVLAMAPCVALSSPILSFGPGSAVTSPDLQANFDTLSDFGNDLNTFSEGGLNVRSMSPSNYGLSYPCDGCAGPTTGVWYVNGGAMYDGYLSISSASGDAIQAVEFLFGSGYFNSAVYMYWETWSDSALTGSATTANMVPNLTPGFSDSDGFDELRLGAYFTQPAGSFVAPAGELRPNAIVIDNLRVQLLPTAVAVPEPSTAMLLLGILPLLGLAYRRRQRPG